MRLSSALQILPLQQPRKSKHLSTQVIYSKEEIKQINARVYHYENKENEVKSNSGLYSTLRENFKHTENLRQQSTIKKLKRTDIGLCLEGNKVTLNKPCQDRREVKKIDCYLPSLNNQPSFLNESNATLNLSDCFSNQKSVMPLNTIIEPNPQFFSKRIALTSRKSQNQKSEKAGKVQYDAKANIRKYRKLHSQIEDSVTKKCKDIQARIEVLLVKYYSSIINPKKSVWNGAQSEIDSYDQESIECENY